MLLGCCCDTRRVVLFICGFCAFRYEGPFALVSESSDLRPTNRNVPHEAECTSAGFTCGTASPQRTADESLSLSTPGYVSSPLHDAMADIDFVFERGGNTGRGIARPAIQAPVDYHICLTSSRRSADCLSQLREMIGLMLAGCTPAGGTSPRSDPGPFASSEAVNQSTPGTARQTRAQPIQRKHLLKCGQGRSSAWCPRIGQQQVSTRQVLWLKTLTNCRLSVERHHTFRCVQTSYLSVLGAIMFDEEI